VNIGSAVPVLVPVLLLVLAIELGLECFGREGPSGPIEMWVVLCVGTGVDPGTEDRDEEETGSGPPPTGMEPPDGGAG